MYMVVQARSILKKKSNLVIGPGLTGFLRFAEMKFRTFGQIFAARRISVLSDKGD